MSPVSNVHVHSCVWLFVTPYSATCQAPSSIHGLFEATILEWVATFSPGDCPNPGIEPVSPASPASAGGFFTTALQLVVTKQHISLESSFRVELCQRHTPGGEYEWFQACSTTRWAMIDTLNCSSYPPPTTSYFSNLTITNLPLVKLWGGHNCFSTTTQPSHGVSLYSWLLSCCWGPYNLRSFGHYNPNPFLGTDQAPKASQQKPTSFMLFVLGSLPSLVLILIYVVLFIDAGIELDAGKLPWTKWTRLPSFMEPEDQQRDKENNHKLMHAPRKL